MNKFSRCGFEFPLLLLNKEMEYNLSLMKRYRRWAKEAINDSDAEWKRAFDALVRVKQLKKSIQVLQAQKHG